MSNVPFFQMFSTHTNFLGFEVPQYWWFRLTYYLTIISCTFALLRFLDVGPTRILEKDGWRNYAGYGISFISVLFVLQAKAQGLGTGGYVMTMLYNKFGFGK